MRIRDETTMIREVGVIVVMTCEKMTPTFRIIPKRQTVHRSGPNRISIVLTILTISIHPRVSA